MLKPYDSKYKGEPITAETVEKLTGLSVEQFITLTGIYGCSDGDIVAEISGHYPFILVVAKNKLAKVEREFDVKSKQIINKLIKVYRPGKGTGTQIYKGQIDAAIKFGFKDIVVWASGGSIEQSTNNGYITLAKFGFTMDKKSQTLFDVIMAKNNRNEKTLHELISTKDGLKFWKEFGRHWLGEFELSEGSVNMQIWESYYKNKSKLKSN